MITRECLSLQDNLMTALDIRFVECCHQEVQVRRERLHDSHLTDLATNDRRDHFGSASIDI